MWTEDAICTWRDQSLSSEGVQRACTPAQGHEHTRKRVLAEMSGNERHATPSPRKSRREDEPYSHQASQDATPKPAHPLNSIPILPSPQTARTSSPHSPLSRSHSTAASTASGSKRKRGPSPSKAMEERQYASYPVKRATVRNLNQVNATIRDLVQEVRRIGNKRGVLSWQYASTEWKEELGEGDDAVDSDIFSGGESRDRRGTLPQLGSMKKVVEQADRNGRLGASEMAWNVNVHGVLLNKAHKRSTWRNLLRWETITTAGISPPTLIPERDERERAESKKVDFCISVDLEEIAGQRLYQMGYRQLNQTDYGPLRYNPIAVSIETKANMEAGAGAQVQLATWCTAQVNHLRALLRATGRSDARIPPLPLVMILGHNWSLYYFEDHGREAILWHSGQFGSTESLLGAYQVLAGLQVLMQWAAETYLPWFKQEILDPLLIPAQG